MTPEKQKSFSICEDVTYVLKIMKSEETKK